MTAPADRPDASTGGFTVAEAAARLGVTPDAVRRRLHRGTLAGDKTDTGEWRVWLPEQSPEQRQDARPDARHDTARTPPAPDETTARTGLAAEMVTGYEVRLAEMSENIAFLRSELESRTEEIRRRDHIIAGLVESVRALPAGEPRQDAPQDVMAAPVRDAVAARASETVRGAQDAQRSAWRRWWRRMTGGAVDLS